MASKRRATAEPMVRSFLDPRLPQSTRAPGISEDSLTKEARMAGGPVGPNAEDSPGPVRMPLRLRTGGPAGSGTSWVLAQLRQSPFERPKLAGERDVRHRM